MTDLKLLDRMDNVKKFESPANVILARGINIKIKDILKEANLKGKKNKSERLTNIEHGLSDDKQVVVPSFGATGALFARHFDILRTLKRRILLLKQSFEFQADEERSWDHIRGIIDVLDKGSKFLTFDELVNPTITGSAQAQEQKSRRTTGNKTFYEDPTLEQDQRDLDQKIEEKR